jgi:hypothetical protein
MHVTSTRDEGSIQTMANVTVEALGAGTKVLSQRMKKAVKKKGVGREGNEGDTV